MSGQFCAMIADRIRASSNDIAGRWLVQLKELLPVSEDEIFPSNQILDHIPSLICEIADYVAADATDVVTANTAIQSKAHELGELRFAQQASVHQLLREYRILGGVIAAFVSDEVAQRARDASAEDATMALARLNEALLVLLQMTVDTFVGRYMERIEQQTARLESFNRMVTHELRDPLQAIQSTIELLRSDEAKQNDQRIHFADVAGRNVARLSHLLRTLATLARPEHDSPQVQTIDLARVVADICRQVEDAAAARRVKVRNLVDATEISVDLARLELVLVNLLSNAIKYRNNAIAEPYVEVRATRTDQHIQLSVADNGLGIPDADQGRVFKRFVRAHRDKDDALGTDGLGLGLSIVADCVKAMHGTVGLQSTEGGGTTVVVTLPVAPQV